MFKARTDELIDDKQNERENCDNVLKIEKPEFRNTKKSIDKNTEEKEFNKPWEKYRTSNE